MKRNIFVLLIFASFSLKGQKMEKIGSEINSTYNELHPLISPDGQTLYFVRANHPNNNFGKDHSNDVWYSEMANNGKWSTAKKMPNTVNKDRYNDLFSISPDGKTILIRGVYEKGRKVSSDIGISVCKKSNRGWSQPDYLDIPKLNKMCKGQFLSAFLSNNGKVLILAFSDKKGSASDDLYFSLKDRKGKWSEPESLGSDINTNDTETTPYLAADERTLYFSSDRKGGLGGTDIWVSQRRGRDYTKWSKPINLGEKINTNTNDMYYSISADGKYAYVANSLNSVGKMDIVKYDLMADRNSTNLASLESSEDGNSQKKDSSQTNSKSGIIDALLLPNAVVVVKGKVINSKTGKPMEATIKYEDLGTGEELGEAQSDLQTGEYTIVLPYGKRYTLRAENNDYIAFEKQLDLTREGEYKEILNENLKIAPIEEGSKVALNNIFFQFAKSNLQEESFFELDRLVSVLKNRSRMIIEVQGHTDNVGSDENNMILSEARANAVRDYLLSKGVKTDQVNSKGFGETQPIATNETSEGQAQNRRVEILIIQK